KNATSYSFAARALNLFVAYEDFEAGRHAESLCSRLGRAEEGEVALKLWRFDVVLNPVAHGAVDEDARGADVVVVAWSSSGGWPNLFTGWRENWARRRKIRDAALAALPANEAAAKALPTLAALRDLATVHKLSFLCDWGGVDNLPETKSD